MGKIRPVYFMHQEGLEDIDIGAILDGASDLIDIARVDIPINCLGVFRADGWKNPDGSLKNFWSVDWYIQEGKGASARPGQLDAQRMQDCLFSDARNRWEICRGEIVPRDIVPGDIEHYKVLAVHNDISCSDTNFIIGIAQENIGTTISTYRFRGLDKRRRYECVKTETMHELGHVFGLPPDNRGEDVEESLGKHCTNRCIMRQGLEVPEDWVRISKDRLEYGPLCNRCRDDLVAYFKS